MPAILRIFLPNTNASHDYIGSYAGNGVVVGSDHLAVWWGRHVGLQHYAMTKVGLSIGASHLRLRPLFLFECVP